MEDVGAVHERPAARMPPAASFLCSCKEKRKRNTPGPASPGTPEISNCARSRSLISGRADARKGGSLAPQREPLHGSPFVYPNRMKPLNYAQAEIQALLLESCRFRAKAGVAKQARALFRAPARRTPERAGASVFSGGDCQGAAKAPWLCLWQLSAHTESCSRRSAKHPHTHRAAARNTSSGLAPLGHLPLKGKALGAGNNPPARFAGHPPLHKGGRGTAGERRKAPAVSHEAGWRM